MSEFITFQMTGKGFKRLTDLLGGMGGRVEEAVKKATLYTEAVIKKDFMTVQDGSLIRITREGERIYTKRTKRPGVRTSTGHLKRNTRSTFRIRGGAFEGAVGTDLPYGIDLEQDPRYEFLKPGLEKAKPVIREYISKAVKGMVERE